MGSVRTVFKWDFGHICRSVQKLWPGPVCWIQDVRFTTKWPASIWLILVVIHAWQNMTDTSTLIYIANPVIAYDFCGGVWILNGGLTYDTSISGVLLGGKIKTHLGGE